MVRPVGFGEWAMSVLNSIAFDEICYRRAIRAGDVTRLARLFAAGAASRDEIEALLTIDRTCPVKDPRWANFVADAMAAHLVDDVDARGYLTRDTLAVAETLLADNPGLRDDVLMAAAERARWIPVELVVELIQRAGASLPEDAAVISCMVPSEGDAIDGIATRVRQALIAYSPDTPVSLRAMECDALAALDRRIGARATPAWEALMRQVIADGVLLATGHLPQGRGRAAMFAVDANDERAVSGMAGLYQRASREMCAIARLEVHRIEIITQSEAPPPDVAMVQTLIATAPDRANTVIGDLQRFGFDVSADLSSAAASRAA